MNFRQSPESNLFCFPKKKIKKKNRVKSVVNLKEQRNCLRNESNLPPGYFTGPIQRIPFCCVTREDKKGLHAALAGGIQLIQRGDFCCQVPNVDLALIGPIGDNVPVDRTRHSSYAVDRTDVLDLLDAQDGILIRALVV
jgi:hypothetical protein